MFIYDPRELLNNVTVESGIKEVLGGFKGESVPPLYKLMDERKEQMVLQDVFRIKRVIFNNPATFVFWKDGTKTVVKCEGEEFDEEKGLAMAISKRALGNTGRYYDTFKNWCNKEDDFSEQIKKDSRFKNIKVKANSKIEEITKDNPLKVGEKVLVLATEEELEEVIIPKKYSLEIGKVEEVEPEDAKVIFPNGVNWWIPNELLRRVIINAKTK